MENRHQESARVFQALCDKKRLMIFELLQSGEKCACVLLEQLDIQQPTLSHHMKILCASGMVTPRKEGKWTHYSICREGCQSAVQLLQTLTMVADKEPSSRRCCEE